MKTKLMLLFCVISLASCGSSSSSSSLLSSNVTYDESIKNITSLGPVTGSGSKSKTDEMTVGGCDLGFPMWDEETQTMYNFFGDTFDSPNQSGRWRSNVMSLSQDDDLSDGFDISSFRSSKSGIATACIDGHHSDKYEMTKIPTGAISIDGVFYMFYFSKYSWKNESIHSMNYGGAIKSSDSGVTWERVYDMTWVDHDKDVDGIDQAAVADIQTLINENADMSATEGTIDVSDHLAYRFTEIFPYDGKDGYVYMFGMGGYRSSWISLARVTYANIEVFDEYEYLTGYDASSSPIWGKGREGLDAIASSESGYCLESTGSELSVTYNPYLKRYCIFMASSSGGSYGTCFFTSKNIYGPYKAKATMVLPASSPLLPQNSTYAPMVDNHWQEEDGKVFYFLVSTWMPNYNPNLFKVEFN